MSILRYHITDQYFCQQSFSILSQDLEQQEFWWKMPRYMNFLNKVD